MQRMDERSRIAAAEIGLRLCRGSTRRPDGRRVLVAIRKHPAKTP